MLDKISSLMLDEAHDATLILEVEDCDGNVTQERLPIKRAHLPIKADRHPVGRVFQAACLGVLLLTPLG